MMLKMDELKAKVESLVASDKLFEALNLLRENVEAVETKKTVNILLTRLSSLEQSQIRENESREYLNIQNCKIINSILSLLKIMDREPMELVIENENEIEILEEILANLRTNYLIYERIRKIRLGLKHKLASRLGELPPYGFIKLFSEYYSKMNKEELQDHQTLRNFTVNILRKHNERILDLLKENDYLKNKIRRLSDLEVHLTIWKTQYDNTIVNDDSICQVYVLGDESRFPDGVEVEIFEYMKNG